MRPWSSEYIGRLDTLEISSQALEGNPLGDSSRRPLYVYVPPGYDDEPERRYPSVYVLQGFTGALTGWAHRTNNFRPTYPEMADELFASGGAPPCLVVFVDAWTSLGGSQFVDSPGTGGITRTSARTWFQPSTPSTAPSTIPRTVECRASLRAGSER